MQVFVACSEQSCSVRLHAAVTRLTVGELALFERLVEALTESEVCMVGGTIQKLFDFKVTGAGLGWSRPGGLLNESMKKRHTRGISNHSSCNIRAEETGSGWAAGPHFQPPLTWYVALAGSGLLLLPPPNAPVRALPTTWPTAEPTATPAAVVAIWAMSPGPWD